jgi:putative ABC transport system substrate-binding protein
MREKFTGLALGAMLFALGASAQGQQPAKTFRIGFLDRGTAASAAHLDSFRHELSKLGWIEHKNLVVEYRFAEGKTERLPELAAELVRLKVDLIVATGAEPMFAAKSATTSIAIVMTGFPDPVGEGLVTSLARPGGNITGFSSLTSELNSKRLEILRTRFPSSLGLEFCARGGPPYEETSG